LEQGPAFLQEMEDIEVKVSTVGRESYGATRAGSHDDLVLAVALACWAMGRDCGKYGEQQSRLLW
jgi:hypothetical protein